MRSLLLMIGRTNRQGRNIALTSLSYNLSKFPRWVQNGAAGNRALLPTTTYCTGTSTAIAATIGNGRYLTTSTAVEEGTMMTNGSSMFSSSGSNHRNSFRTNDRRARNDSKFHLKMNSLAEQILTSTALSSSSLVPSSTNNPLLSATDAKKVILHFHGLHCHRIAHLRQLLQQQQIALSGHPGLNSTGPMLAKVILTKLLQLDQHATSNTTASTKSNYLHQYVSQDMFYPIIYGFSMLPNYLGGNDIECFDQAREVLSMFQQWTTRALSNHNRQQQQPLEECLLIGMDSDKKWEVQKSHIASFNTLLKILVKIGTIEAAGCAERMLLELSELYDTDTTGTFPPPNIESFNTVLRTWSQAAALSPQKRQQGEDESSSSNSYYCAEKAEELLRFLQSLHPTSATSFRQTPLLQPNNVSYNIVMHIWASIGDVERVESLFKEMEREAARTEESLTYSSTTSTLHPTRQSFKAVMDAYKNNKEDKYKKAAHIAAMNMLCCLEDIHEQYYPDVRPNTAVLNDVIECWLLADVDDAPIQIDSLITRMEQLVLQDSGAQYIQPDAHTYSMAIAAWNQFDQREVQRNTHLSTIHPLDASQRAEGHLRQLVQLVLQDSSRRNNSSASTQGKTSTPLVSTDQFHTVLSLYSQCSGTNPLDASIPQKADEILALMKQCSLSGMHMMKPTLQTYSLIFNIWSNSQHPDRGRRCEDILIIMEHMTQNLKFSAEYVPQSYYKKTIDALLSRTTAINENSKSSKIEIDDAVWRAEVILQRMANQTQHSNVVEKRRLESCYVAVARKLFKLKTKEATAKAEELKERLRASVNADDVGYKILSHLDTVQDKGLPITREFIVKSTKLMSTLPWAQSYNTAEMAKRILLKIVELSRIHEKSERPDILMINIALNVCAKCALEGAQKAQGLLEDLERQEVKDSGGSLLCNVSYSTVMRAWGKSNDKNAPSRVLELLNKIERRWHQRSIKPDYGVYKCSIYNILASPTHNSGKMAHIAIDKMIKAGFSPHPVLARKVMEACCDSGEIYRAEDILEASKSVMDKFPPENYDGDLSRFIRLSLELILKYYLQKASSRIAATDHAEKIIYRIISLCDARNPSSTPQTACIIAVLNALLDDNLDDGAQRAYEILRYVMKVQKREGVIFSPSKPVYDNVLDCLINSKANQYGRLPEIGGMADWILENVEDPDQHSYSLGILAWSCSRYPDKGERAQRLFDRMRQSCTFIPEPHVYQNLLDAWANGSSKDKAERANLVLSDLVEQCNSGDCTFNPTVNHINAVLQACARTPSTENSHAALRVAISVFRQLRDMPSVEPNEGTFQMMFEVCERFILDQEKRDKLSEKLFREACQGGFLTQGLLESFWNVSSHGLRKRCLGLFQTDLSSELSVSNFPDEWKFKVNQSSHAI